MKKIILITALFVPSIYVMAEGSREKRTFFDKFSVGVHTGIDIGGAMPLSISDALGSDDKVNVTPRVRPAIGLSLTKHFNDRWSLSLESFYRFVGLDITTRVQEQIFVDREEDVWVAFRGTAHMEMAFPMFEFALYGRYAFENFGGRVILGAFYSRNVNPRFIAEPRKGMLFGVIDGRPNFNDPGGIISPDDPFTQDFSDAMSRWDLGILVGYEQRLFFPQLFISGRLAMGFNDIFHPDSRYLAFKMQHVRASLALSYHFR
ncbi:MAG: PorT family protein [Bacteroidales bacterium]|nr:PorT family protein [Bacteroidales bacterium]